MRYWKGKIEELRGTCVPVLICPPQIPYGLALGSKAVLNGKRQETNQLSRGTTILQ